MRALLAGNQVWLRSALRLLLEHEANIEVVGEVGNAQILPAVLRDLRPDLLLLDWQLPSLGPDSVRHYLLKTMRAILPHLYIIALTTDNTNHRELLNTDAYINKAEPPKQILAVLQQAKSQITLSSNSPQ
jgi:DNA-binding NarL/FixJ family response regulator